MLHRTTEFEPSTWAEVEDAAASGKDTSSRASDPIIPEILSFTSCSARCVDRSIPPPPRAGSPRALSVSAASAGPCAPAASSSAAPATPAAAAPSPPRRRAERGRADDGPPALPPAPTPRRHKRGAAHIDDVLGLGRVDVELEAFVRRYSPDHPPSHSVPRLPMRSADAAENAAVESEVAAIASVLNPASELFDPGKYVSKVHADTSLEDLRQGLTNLESVSASLEKDAALERAHAHARLAVAAAAVEQTRRFAHAAPGFSTLLDSIDQGSDQFAVAGEALDDKYRDILERERQIERLKRVQALVRRFSWLLALPEKLRAAAKGDSKVVEEATTFLKRAKAWSEAQDGPVGPARSWIEKELEQALDEFVAAMERRLSHAVAADRADLPAFVNMLELVGRERSVEVALSARVAAAKEALMKVGRANAVSAVVRVRVGDRGGHHDVVSLMNRLSNAFVDGLGDVWDLGGVLARRPRWYDAVEAAVSALVDEYAECVRKVLLSDSQIVSREAMLELGRAQRRAFHEIRVPPAFLASLREIVEQVVDMHLASLARSVKNCAGHVARTCFEADTVGTQLPLVARALVAEIIAEARDLVDMEMTETSTPGSSANAPVSEPDSNLHKLAVACVRVPEFIVQTLRELVSERSRGAHVLAGSYASSSIRSTPTSSNTLSEAAPTSTSQISAVEVYGYSVLGTARCCSVLVDGNVIESICELVKELAWTDSVELHRQSVAKKIKSVLVEAVRVYCRRLAPEVRWAARRIGELRSADGLQTSLSMEIDSASAQAVEVVLNICLAVCRARQLGAKKEELQLVEKHLTEQVADILVSSMSTTSSATDMAAQIWVDISFLMAILEDGRGQTGGRKAKDLFLQAQRLASAAVRASGVSFGAAEEETLKRVAIDPSVKRSKLMRQAMTGRVVERKLPDSLWVRNAMAETVRRAVEQPK